MVNWEVMLIVFIVNWGKIIKLFLPAFKIRNNYQDFVNYIKHHKIEINV